MHKPLTVYRGTSKVPCSGFASGVYILFQIGSKTRESVTDFKRQWGNFAAPRESRQTGASVRHKRKMRFVNLNTA